jgi:GrpB-like predicted nucleotidyltransferase (UPF0157 family)/RimJ/RimL family protein N-acetyltransferase
MGVFLDTNRLLLRTTELSDFDDILALRSDPEVMKYIGNGSIQSREQVKESLNLIISYQREHRIGFCSVFEKASGHFIGQAGLFHVNFDDKQPEIEIAYRLHTQYWGKGYATELAKALIYWGFEHLAVNKLIAIVDLKNLASQKVLKKAGLDLIDEKSFYYNKPVLKYEIYKNDSIQLVSYSSDWPKQAELEIKNLYKLLPSSQVIDIQHVGSTAIPGIQAKPIIDLQIAVNSLQVIKPLAIEKLKRLGYQYWAENPDPERLFFVKGMPPFGESRTHHVHIVELSSRHWKEKILFRDYLKAHPEIAQDYEKLKQDLAKQYTYDRETYTSAKSEFIDEILRKAKKRDQA